jgi:hypothetical protein
MVIASPPPVSALVVVRARTPPLRVAHFRTTGTYPLVVGLRRVDAGLRRAVLADEHEYARYARREKPKVGYRVEGVYSTAVDRRLLSASTVVVSALMPAKRELFPGQPGGDDWLGITVRAPSWVRVVLADLFASPQRGLRVLAAAWRARIRRTSAAPCLRAYPEAYAARIRNYSAFALTPRGIAVGTSEIGACYRLVATVPYRVLRPYLSDLGAALVTGVRTPKAQPPRRRRLAAAWFARSAHRSQQ